MKKGFTLIELLVVIAIIGVIAGIVASSIRSKNLPLDEYCDGFELRRMADVPVKCLNHFNLKK